MRDQVNRFGTARTVSICWIPVNSNVIERPSLNAVEADLSLARGRVVHARFIAATTSSGMTRGPGDVADELVLFERARQL